MDGGSIMKGQSTCCNLLKKTELLAPGRPIRALASDGCWAARFGWGEPISRRSGCEAQRMLRRAFRCCEPSSVRHSTKDVASVLRTCSEHVANEVTRNIQHRASSLPPPPHVATMLRPVLRATSNIRSPPSPPSWHNTQHYMSATSKLNIRNIC
jgi:hypothetical protein